MFWGKVSLLLLVTTLGTSYAKSYDRDGALVSNDIDTSDTYETTMMSETRTRQHDVKYDDSKAGGNEGDTTLVPYNNHNTAAGEIGTRTGGFSGDRSFPLTNQNQPPTGPVNNNPSGQPEHPNNIPPRYPGPNYPSGPYGNSGNGPYPGFSGDRSFPTNQNQPATGPVNNNPSGQPEYTNNIPPRYPGPNYPSGPYGNSGNGPYPGFSGDRSFPLTNQNQPATGSVNNNPSGQPEYPNNIPPRYPGPNYPPGPYGNSGNGPNPGFSGDRSFPLTNQNQPATGPVNNNPSGQPEYPNNIPPRYPGPNYPPGPYGNSGNGPYPGSGNGYAAAPSTPQGPVNGQPGYPNYPSYNSGQYFNNPGQYYYNPGPVYAQPTYPIYQPPSYYPGAYYFAPAPQNRGGKGPLLRIWDNLHDWAQNTYVGGTGQDLRILAYSGPK